MNPDSQSVLLLFNDLHDKLLYYSRRPVAVTTATKAIDFNCEKMFCSFEKGRRRVCAAASSSSTSADAARVHHETLGATALYQLLYFWKSLFKRLLLVFQLNLSWPFWLLRSKSHWKEVRRKTPYF